jgi:hypothetical protein
MVSTILEDFLNRNERSEKIDLVFDGCSELRACIESYEIRRTEFPPSMRKIAGEVIPGDDHELAGLQAADLLAGEHSAYLKSGTKRAPYMEFEQVGMAIMAFPANPPVNEINALLHYAQAVFQRAKETSAMVEFLKSNGIKLDDFK